MHDSKTHLYLKSQRFLDIAWQFIHVIPLNHYNSAWLNFVVFVSTPPVLDESYHNILSFYTEAENRRFTSPQISKKSILYEIKWYNSIMLKIGLCEKYSFKLRTWIHYIFNKNAHSPKQPKTKKKQKQTNNIKENKIKTNQFFYTHSKI